PRVATGLTRIGYAKPMSRWQMLKLSPIVLAAAVVIDLHSAAAQAPFYQGKQLRLLVGFTSGGGTDLFARAIADGLAHSLEGNPSVLVQNMPGASSVVAMNYFVQKAAHDGSMVFIASGQALMRMILGLDGAKAKISQMQAMIATPMGRVTYAAAQTGTKSPADILHPREALMAGVPEVISS